MPLLKEHFYTIEDIYNLPEGERAELIDGHIYKVGIIHFFIGIVFCNF